MLRKATMTVGVVLAASLSVHLRAAVVYDGITNSIPELGSQIDGMYVLKNGQQISLSGTERVVTSFELFLGASDPHDYSVGFFLPDGVDGSPNTKLWDSGTKTYPFEPPF